MNNQFDFIIIGAGIIGLSISERLSRKYNNILLVEKESKFGQHTSSRNSEVIHSGFYYPPDSLKSKLCVRGNKLIYDFCKKYNIPFKKCGKLIVAKNLNEEKELKKNLKNAINNGLENLEILSELDAKKIEPNISCNKALWIPSTGIMDSHLVMAKLENLSISRDVSILYNLELSVINKTQNGYSIKFKNNDNVIYTKQIINCAGLWSHKLVNKLLKNKYEIEYYKGDYFKTNQLKNLNCLIYPIPQKSSLGIHAILNLNGEVLFGPNLYKVNSIDYSTTDKYKTMFLKEANKLISKNIINLSKDYSGIRPKIKSNKDYNDFIIKEEPTLKNFYSLLGIDSPGLTSSLAIGEYVYSLIDEKLNQ